MAEEGDNFTYSYNQFNQLLDIKKNSTAWSTFTYDLNGNQIKDISKKDVSGTIKDITTDYTYDRLDRLTNISVSDGTVTKTSVNYYNGDGQRIKKDTEGLVTKYYYDGDAILYTADSNNVKEAENILGPAGEIIASKRFDGIYANMYFFYNYDIRGSVTNIIKPDGTLVKGYTYDEYGKTRDKGDSSFVNEVKFTGAVQEDIANIYLMGARYYNPDTGRFLTQDSYSGNPYDPWTQHLYSYCSGNPTSMVDPTGHRQMRVTDGEGGGGNPDKPAPVPDKQTTKKKRVTQQRTGKTEEKEYNTKAGKKIKDNAQNIIDAANLYGVDPRIVAGVIYAEQSINVDFKDTLTDWLGFYGVNTSIGLGQVRLSTAAFLEEKGYVKKTTSTEGGWDIPFIGKVHGTITMARKKRLENDRVDVIYVGAYIKYFQDTWNDEFPSIADRPEILGTLYNIGHEVTKPNSSPESNEFGDYVKDNYDTMGYLLGLK